VARLDINRQNEIWQDLLNCKAPCEERNKAVGELGSLLNNVIRRELATANLLNRRDTKELIDDLKQEAYLELLIANNDYSPFVAQYITFAETKFRTAVQRSIRNWKKEQHISTSSSPVKNDESATLEQILTSEEDFDKQEEFILQIFEQPKEKVLCFNSILTPLQSKIIRYRVEKGLSFRDIGQKMNMSHEEARKLYLEAINNCKLDRAKRKRLIEKRIKRGAYIYKPDKD
jgi:RNA polymerase sigma factor (sigma-70 family)